MKPRMSGTVIVAAFGRELAKLRNHPEVAWERAWALTADDSIFDKHDEIKEIAFAIYGVADKQRLKTRFFAPMGARPPEISAAYWHDDSPCTLHCGPAWPMLLKPS